jgi:hypothetical protein
MFWLPFLSAKYRGEVSFSERFYNRAVVIKIAGFFLFVICAFSISYYIWICARALIRFIFSEILSLGRIIAKMTLSDSFSFEIFRDFLI